MALIKCKECGGDVSKKAKACPSCGAPAKKKTTRLTWLVLIFAGAVVISGIMAPPSTKKITAPVVLTVEQKQAREAELVAELKAIPAVEVKKNLEAYRELVKLNPGNEKYPIKVVYYEGKMVRYNKIQGQFSWSGAHRSIERYVKARLKDPDSYEHIETRYNDNGDHLLVMTKYRAKNSFGGFAIETTQARCTIEGDCTLL